MWVPRIPKRADFCGCPPCPLCYDWATEAPAGRVQDAWVQEIISGMTKFTDDVLEGKKPTESEKETLQKAAESIHVANLSRDERIAEEIRSADKAQHTQRQMEAMLADRRAEAARPKPLNTVTLDGMDLSYVEEEEKRKKEPKKPEPAMWPAGVIGLPSYASFFNDVMQKEIERAFYMPSSFLTFGVDVASAAPPKIGERAAIDDKERRRLQAEEDAKKRMKLQAREPVRR